MILFGQDNELETLGLPNKQVFLEDKDKTLAYPGDMHDDNIKFHTDITEYKKSPSQSIMELLSEPDFWYRQEAKAKELGQATVEFASGVGQVLGQDVMSAVGQGSEDQRLAAMKQVSSSGFTILNSVFETFVGRAVEPVRQFVGDIATGETENIIPNTIKAVIDPSSVEKISYRLNPVGPGEGAADLIPLAVAGAIEDVFFYSGGFKNITKMIDNYQVNEASSLVKNSMFKLRDRVANYYNVNEAQAWEIMQTPPMKAAMENAALRVVKQSAKSQLFGGLPADVNPASAGKAVGDVVAGAAKSPAVAAKVVVEGMKTRSFVKSIQEELPQVKVSGQYIPRNTDELAIKARTQIKDNIAVAEKMAMTGTDDASIATGAELLKYYSTEAANATSPAVKDALYEKASELGNDMAERLTELGRSVQAASILSRLTPEGQIRFAAKTIQKYNLAVEKDSGIFGLKKKVPELTTEQTKFIVEKMNDVSALPEGDMKAIKFRDLQNYVSDLVPTPLYKKIVTIWKAGLLTGLKTSGTNIFSNASHAFTEIAKDIPAAAVDSVLSLFTRKRAVAFTVKGTVKGAKEGFIKGWRFLKTGYDERNVLGKLEYSRVNFGKGKVAKALQAYEESIFKLLGAEDQVFYYGAKARSIAEQATVEAINKGLKGKEANQFIDDLIQNPTDDMVAYAVADAEVAVFQNKTVLSKAGETIKKIPLAEFLLPFSKTPSAVAVQILNYSPAGAIKTLVQNIGKGKFNQRDFSKGMGRSLLGLPALWLGYYLFKNKRIALDRPTSESERKLWELEGKKPNSIKIGDKWRTIQVFGPVGNLLLIGGQYGQALDKEGSPTKAMIKATAGGVKSLTEQTFLTGISSGIEAVKDPERSAGYFVSQMVSSAIPTIVADVAKATDTKERRAFSIADRLKSRIPILRQYVEPQVDVLGRERMIKENFFETMADPTRPLTEIKDPVVQEIRRLEELGYNISTSQVGDKEGYKILTPQQNTELFQRSGSIAYDKLLSYMDMESYQGIDEDQKSKDINKIFDKAKVVARAEMILELTKDLVTEEEVVAVLKEAKKSKLMSKEVLDLYNRMR